MEITYLPTLIPFLKEKFLLLDTNVFRDAAVKPTIFNNFINTLKTAGTTIATIDLVKFELLKGSANKQKYSEKESFISQIIDATIPLNSKAFELGYNLIQQYELDGTAVHITDLMLGALLMQYGKQICLLTRDTSDFNQNIFDLLFIVNAPHSKGIFTYGVYQYSK